jgi:hypothetical protein
MFRRRVRRSYGLQTRKNAELALARLKSSGRDLGALGTSECRT